MATTNLEGEELSPESECGNRLKPAAGGPPFAKAQRQGSVGSALGFSSM